MVSIKYNPFRAKIVSQQEIFSELENTETQRILFTEKIPVIDISGNNKMLDKNKGVLILDVGRLKNECLEESCLSTKDASPNWKKIASDLRKKTCTGAVAVNEKTNVVAVAKTHRFTPGARKLADSGVSLRQYASLPTFFHFE